MSEPTKFDQEYEDQAITKVEPQGDGWVISSGIGCFFCPNAGIEPKKGDTARFYGKGFGYTVRGLQINGKTVFYRTEAEQRAKDKADAEESDRKRKAEFETKGKSELDADYALLPLAFQKRLDRFRRNNPDFRWRNEGYEMYVCKQAVAFADALKTPDAVKEFQALPYNKQRKMVEALDDGHSGNTFGAACRLAWLYLRQPEAVEKEHGALCPLLGCHDYGCVPKGSRKYSDGY